MTEGKVAEKGYASLHVAWYLPKKISRTVLITCDHLVTFLTPCPLIRHISAEWLSLGKWKNEKEVGSFFWCLWICAQTRNFAFSMSVPSHKAHHNLFHHFLNLGYKNGPQTKVWEIEPFNPLLTLSFIKYLQSVNKVSGTGFQNELLLN